MASLTAAEAARLAGPAAARTTKLVAASEQVPNHGGMYNCSRRKAWADNAPRARQRQKPTALVHCELGSHSVPSPRVTDTCSSL